MAGVELCCMVDLSKACGCMRPNEFLRQLFFIFVSNEVLFDSEICETKVLF